MAAVSAGSRKAGWSDSTLCCSKGTEQVTVLVKMQERERGVICVLVAFHEARCTNEGGDSETERRIERGTCPDKAERPL
uniref:Uncharacterized protein n=1 Tax=Vespula pensylvanica TaxID=30213 RepID=A0A834P4E0_VESPE|nr:hypothetical protein H0235_007176 [Vespula pensylvanica]